MGQWQREIEIPPAPSYFDNQCSNHWSVHCACTSKLVLNAQVWHQSYVVMQHQREIKFLLQMVDCVIATECSLVCLHVLLLCLQQCFQHKVLVLELLNGDDFEVFHPVGTTRCTDGGMSPKNWTVLTKFVNINVPLGRIPNFFRKLQSLYYVTRRC